MSRFPGKRAIVTGGGRGIGEAVARRLYDEGASVMVVSRTEAEVGSVASALGERALAHVADVSLEADVQGIVDRALEVWVVSTSSSTTPASMTTVRFSKSRPRAGSACSGST